MTIEQRLKWAGLVTRLRTCNAAAEAIHSGFVDNHGSSLGDPIQAADRLAANLITSAALAVQLCDEMGKEKQ